ncbi:MAG TPA: serine/threonine-protein kinase [Gemmatimonas sp.]|uniref:serine/threonine-protein kinase n=1 Tax=Gemmatimonas sp. TaxID=1962908 RepID=UPI002EDBB011
MDRDALRARLTELLGVQYALHEELGGGGMSVVYRATERAFERAVVIKVLAPELTQAINAKRFVREINIAARLQHPNIVPMLAAQVDQGIPYYVMPYVKGRSLRERMSTGAVPVAEALSMLRDIARALAYAHGEGVVHRDIKPENVLLSGRVAMVTDFGIAKALAAASAPEVSAESTASHTLTQYGTSIGTPRYIAPEQAVAGDVDHRADLYSWGVMAYELLAGVHMFAERGSPRQMLAAHIAEMPRPLQEAAPSVPQPLAQLIMHTLAKDPDQRPASADELLALLDGYDIAVSGERFPSGPLMPTQAVSTRSAVAKWAAAAVLFVAAAIGAAVWKTQSRTALDETLLVSAPFRVSAADPALQYLREGMIDLLSANLTTPSMRMAAPRTMVEAFTKTTGATERDASEAQALETARHLGAGRLLLGDVVATPKDLTFTVRVLNVARGTSSEAIRVNGSVDSVAQLVDRLSLAILTELAPEETRRRGTVGTTSVVALRSYLEGLATLRRAQHIESTQAFLRAIEADTTFALAGIGLRLAAAWNGNQDMMTRGTDVAWRHRARLSDGDRALLTALVGSRYPDITPSVQKLDDVRRYVALAPQRAEAWYLLGDALFHYGHIAGASEDSVDAESREAFVRALDLDSTYLSAAVHLTDLAAWHNDNALLERVSRLRSAADSNRVWLWEVRWYQAVKANAPNQRIWRDSLVRRNYGHFTQVAMHEGVGAREGVAVYDSVYRLARGGDPARMVTAGSNLVDWLLLLGRPAEAQRVMAAIDSIPDANVAANSAVRRLRGAILGEHDTTGVGLALQRLMADESLTPTDFTSQSFVLRAVRAAEMWRLAHGDSSKTHLSKQRLAAAVRGTPAERDVDYALSVTLIDALHAHLARDTAMLRARLQHLDSLLANLDYSRAHEARTAFTALEVARLWESLNEPARALVTLRRSGDRWQGSITPYLATRLRRRARLAAALGHHAEARWAGARYLAYRFEPEPAMRAQEDSVKRLLSGLTKPGR